MIAAERMLAVPRDRVFAFLSHLPNHWDLHAALVEVETTGETEARVRLQGPAGIARDAYTRVLAVEEPSRLRGVAEVGSRTVARVAWDLEAVGESTRVRLSTEIERASFLDRIVLALGGTWWLRRVYAESLENLEHRLRA